MHRLTTLLFDVDGTLAETEEIHRQAFNSAFQRAGLDWHWSEEMYRELLTVTGGKERMRYYLDTHKPDFTLPGPGTAEASIAALHASKTEIYTHTVAAGQVPMRPGVRRVLCAAREAGLRLGIATTTTRANVTALLQHSLAADAESWFDVIAAGGVVAAKKPAPDIYHYVMREMGVTADQCLAFEDTENGLRSALAADVQTLVTVSRYSAGQDFRGAALVLDQLGEPGEPFQVAAGDAHGHNVVSLELLYALHAAAGE